MDSKTRGALDKAAIARISEFRYQMRVFLRVSEDAAREVGLTTLQYQLMLHTQAFEGRDWASVGELAERLQAQHHGVVALVTRCEQAGLVRRQANAQDRRLVEVHLTAKGRRSLERMARLLEPERQALARVIELAQGQIDSV